MKRANYQDGSGCWYAVWIPDSATEEDAALGVPIGPPSFDDMGLRETVRVRLHNELYHRGILTDKDARRARQEVAAAIAVALKLDTEIVLAYYAGLEENKNDG